MATHWLAEGSGIAGLVVPVLIGLLAPTGTPEAVIDRLNREIGVIVRRPETREAWGKMGATTLVTTPAEFGRMLGAETAKWSALIRDAKLTLDP